MFFKSKKKQKYEPDAVPTTVEEAIPLLGVCEDGICLVGRNLWSKTFRFTDINYSVASGEDREGLFYKYADILNSMDDGATTKITINNRRIHRSQFEKTNMIPLMGDRLDDYRREYNSILERNANLSCGIVQDKYLTVTVEKRTLEEARAYFTRVESEYRTMFASLGSDLYEVNDEEKLRMIYDFFHR